MENLLGTKTAVRLISTLLKNPEKEFSEIGLIRESDVGKGAGADAISRLALAGVVRTMRVGKTKTVKFNAANPIAFGLRQIFGHYKLMSLPAMKVSAIFLFRNAVYAEARAIVLFGSLAAGTYDEKSDIDLLVITGDEAGARKAKADVFEVTGEKINVHFLKPPIAKKEYEENALVKNALAFGILIYGSDYAREIMKPRIDIKEFVFLKERLVAAWRNYLGKDYEAASEIIYALSEDLSFLACKIEGIGALSRKDALAKIKKTKEYGILADIGKLEKDRQMNIMEEIYARLLERKVLLGEEIERRAEK